MANDWLSVQERLLAVEKAARELSEALDRQTGGVCILVRMKHNALRKELAK